MATDAVMHPNLSREDAIQFEMKRTGMTRAQVLAAGEAKKAEMEAKLDALLAADNT